MAMDRARLKLAARDLNKVLDLDPPIDLSRDDLEVPLLEALGMSVPEDPLSEETRKTLGELAEEAKSNKAPTNKEEKTVATKSTGAAKETEAKVSKAKPAKAAKAAKPVRVAKAKVEKAKAAKAAKTAPADRNGLIGIAEVAKALGRTVESVRYMTKLDHIPSSKDGRLRLYDLAAVNKAIEKRGAEKAAE